MLKGGNTPDRVQLGLLLRYGGPHYRYSILLSAAELCLLKICESKSTLGDMRHPLDSVDSLIASIVSYLGCLINVDSKSITEQATNILGIISQEPMDNVHAVTSDESTSAIIGENIDQILGVVNTLCLKIEEYKLEGCWDIRKHIFTSIYC